MIEFQHRTEIDRSPAEVFALLSDIERFPAWQQSVVAIERKTSGPLGMGSEFDQTWKTMGRTRQVPTRVAAYRVDELVAFAGDAGFADYYCGFELSATARGGTTLVSRNEFRLHGAWKLVQPLLGREMRRELTRELAMLKRQVEAGGGLSLETAPAH